MRSNNREYLPAVDHLRFAAAALVVLFHTFHYLRPDMDPAAPGVQPNWVYSRNPVLTFLVEGRTGVALFMVLSGFILTTGSLGRELNYRSFLRNRLLRVGPLYLLVLMIALVVSGAHFSVWGAVQTTLGFSRFPGGFTAGAFARVLWTVGVELQFYVLFPVFLKLLNTRGPWSIVQFISLVAVLRIVAALSAPGLDYDQLTYYSLVGRIDQFLIGMLAAYLFPRIRQRIGKVWVVAVALLAVMAALWANNQLHGVREPHLWRTVYVDVEALVWAAVLLSYVATARFARGRLSAALAWGGERSYGIYLLHVAVLEIVLFRGWELNVPGGYVFDTVATGLVLVLPGATLLAALSYSAVERPFLSLRKRYVSLAAVPSPTERPGATVSSVTPVSEPGAEAGATAPELPLVPAQRGGASTQEAAVS